MVCYTIKNKSNEKITTKIRKISGTLKKAPAEWEPFSSSILQGPF